MADEQPTDRQFCDDVTPPYDLEDAWEDDPRGEDEEDGDSECGLLADGQCLLAGSEWCDWDCGRSG